MAQFGIKDFIDLDIFFWYLYKEVVPKGKVEKKVSEKPALNEKIAINTHEAAEYYLLELGKMLGFNPYTVDSSKEFGRKKLGDIAESWKLMGEQSEWVLTVLKGHEENAQIPVNQLVQFMHFFMNMLGLGGQSILFLGPILPF